MDKCIIPTTILYLYMSFLSNDAGPPHDEVGEEYDPQDAHPQRQWPELAPELSLKYHIS